MMRKFYSMSKENDKATINIYTEIASYTEGAADYLSKKIDGLKDVKQIDVYINSPGGEVFEGLAIYNSLKRHKAKVVTHCDGMAASIASVIFLAGEERVMCEASFLMIHNAWGVSCGNAAEMRKYADDLEKVTQASIEIYKANSTLSEEEIKELMAKETILYSDEALEYGFATKVENSESNGKNQSGRKWLMDILKKYKDELEEEEAEEETTEEETTEEPAEDEAEAETETETETGEENPEEEEVVEELDGEEETAGTENDIPEDGESQEPSPEEPAEDENGEETDEENTEEAEQKIVRFFNSLIKN